MYVFNEILDEYHFFIKNVAAARFSTCSSHVYSVMGSYPTTGPSYLGKD